jgi:hypothetical protein
LIELFSYQSLVIFSILCALSSIILFRNSNQVERSFHYYIITKAFFEILATVSAKLFENNLFGLHIYTIVQFVVLTLFFRNCFKIFNIKFKYFLILGIGICPILLNSIFIQPLDTFNSYTRFLVELYMILISIFLFIVLIQNRKHDQQYMQASVTFISTLFIEASGSLIFYLYSNKIIKMDKYYSDILFDIRLGVNYVVMLLISYGLYQIYMKNRTNLKLKL